MDTKTDLQIHKAEINAHKSISRLRDNLTDLANKLEGPSQKIRTVRSGYEKTMSLPWREIALGVGALFVLFKIKNYITMPKNK